MESMMEEKDRDRLEAERFLDNLLEFLSDCSDETTEDLEAELRQDGIDTDSLIRNVRNIVESKLTESRLGWQKGAKEKAQQVLGKMTTVATRTGELLSRKELQERIRSLVAAHGPQLSLEHRKLESMTDDDLRNALQDLEALVSLKELEHKPDPEQDE